MSLKALEFLVICVEPFTCFPKGLCRKETDRVEAPLLVGSAFSWCGAKVEWVEKIVYKNVMQ